MLMSWTLPAERRAADETSRTEVLRPRVDVLDEGDAYRLIVEMPGVSQDALSVQLEADELLLRGTRKPLDEERLFKNGRRADLPFEARFALGGDVDRGKIRARLEEGLVYVTLPRKEEDKPRKIEVEIG
jgi:HSP20 family molecular chaperone IbpA